MEWAPEFEGFSVTQLFPHGYLTETEEEVPAEEEAPAEEVPEEESPEEEAPAA